jgi:large subunit ribosomal protein L14
MIQPESRLVVADNSGAKRLKCIRVLRSGDTAEVGDIIIASVVEAEPRSRMKGTVVKAVVVRTVQPISRPSGISFRYDQNAAVLIKENGDPLGTRVFGPVARELRSEGYTRILSLAPEVL